MSNLFLSHTRPHLLALPLAPTKFTTTIPKSLASATLPSKFKRYYHPLIINLACKPTKHSPSPFIATIVATRTGTRGNRGRSRASYSSSSSAKDKFQNAGLIAFLTLTVGSFSYIGYLLISSLFNEDSPTRIYNHALDEARKIPALVDLFGPKFTGLGEPSQGRLQRNRTIAHSYSVNKKNQNVQTVRFYIFSGDKNRQKVFGIVTAVLVQQTTLNAKNELVPSWNYYSIAADIYPNTLFVQHGKSKTFKRLSAPEINSIMSSQARPLKQIDIFLSDMIKTDRFALIDIKKRRLSPNSSSSDSPDQKPSASWFGMFSFFSK